MFFCFQKVFLKKSFVFQTVGLIIFYKVLGAHRAQIKKVILPWANRKDVEHDVAPEIRGEMQFVFVRTVKEALEAAFGKDGLHWRRNDVLLESRL